MKRTLVVALGAALVACGPGGETSRPAEPAATPLAFTAHGLPGPWWRVGASPREFQRDSRTCRQQSTRARQRARTDALEAAYRAFLECMEARRWQRGVPAETARLGSGPEPASGTIPHRIFADRPRPRRS